LAYALGARSVVSGQGEIALAEPYGLRIVLDDLPAGLGGSLGHPPVLIGAGLVSVGNALGWLPPVRLVHEEQLLLNLPPFMTRLGYTLALGASATIDELLAEVLFAPGSWSEGDYGVGPYA
jgi:hypothetical protein